MFYLSVGSTPKRGPCYVSWLENTVASRIKDLGRQTIGEGSKRIHQIKPPTSVELVWQLSPEDLTAFVKNARFFIWSLNGYYETFGYATMECFANGVLGITSNIGVISEVAMNENTGLYSTRGDPADLAEKVQWACIQIRWRKWG